MPKAFAGSCSGEAMLHFGYSGTGALMGKRIVLRPRDTRARHPEMPPSFRLPPSTWAMTRRRFPWHGQPLIYERHS